MRILLSVLTLLLVAACGTQNPPAIPTLALLPTLTEPVAETPLSSETPTPEATPTDAPSPSPTDPPTATETPTLTSTPQPTLTDTPQPTVTFTPSLTITNTVTPPPTATFTATLELSGLGMLADLAARTTILPPEQLYNPGTLTAVAFAAQTQSAAAVSALTPTAAVIEAGDGLLPFSTPGPATFPPTPITCAFPPPAGLSAVFAADPALFNSLGCPTNGAPTSNTTAVQTFERGLMVYVAGTPGSIYVLMSDGRFRRFDDTWIEGVHPDSAGMSPPPGLIEPIRGFGKVWRDNLDVQSALGWGVTPEAGDTSSIQLFERGRAITLPQIAASVILVDDLGGSSGTWRANPGGF